MVNLEDSSFIIKDVLFWSYLNGMPKSRDIALDIDKELGVESKIVGEYNYVQGYKKNGSENYYTNEPKYKKEPNSDLGKRYRGSGLGLKPAYEPIILIQKPILKGKILLKMSLRMEWEFLILRKLEFHMKKERVKLGIIQILWVERLQIF